ncbi:MAG: hypothetical protein IPN38_17180 [Flavobacteriales bacterium]|nr:hypothetical protein [Flavobacteriales bacterium]
MLPTRLSSSAAPGLRVRRPRPNSHKDPSLPIPARVSDLLARMSPDEKFRQLFMVAGDLGEDSSRFTNGIFGFQLNATQQVATPQSSCSPIPLVPMRSEPWTR